jgi:hypothetical protein
LCLGQGIHIEVKPVNQAEDGLFAGDNVVRREDCHCLLLFKVDLLFTGVDRDIIQGGDTDYLLILASLEPYP